MPLASIHSKQVTEDPWTVKLQELVVKLLCRIANKGAEPTKENTNKHNSHILCDIRDTILARETNKARKEAIRGIWNTGIIKYETCGFYSDHLDEALFAWLKSDWVFKSKDEKIRKKQVAEAFRKGELYKIPDLVK